MTSNQTVYVQNLNEKVKVDDIRKMLYHLFSTCGPVLDVNVRKTNKLRGQAWVVYDDLAASTKAVKTLNGTLFCGKPLKIQFSTTKSHLIAKADGTYVAPTAADAAASAAGGAASAPSRPKRAATDSADGAPSAKAARTTAAGARGETAAAGGGAGAGDDEEEEEEEAAPNKVLFAEGLPPSMTLHMAERFFENAVGFTAARLDPARPGVAFIEFDSAESAGAVINAMQGYKFSPQHALKLSFAR